MLAFRANLIYSSYIPQQFSGFQSEETKMNEQDKKIFEEHKEDMAAIAEQVRYESEENARREWAQRNGNDSGFDPYWDIE